MSSDLERYFDSIDEPDGPREPREPPRPAAACDLCGADATDGQVMPDSTLCPDCIRRSEP